MVQKFRMPKYVNIWHSTEKGNKDNEPLKAEMGGTRKIGGKLMVRTLAPHWKEKDLGTILEGEESQDSGYDFRTEQGWFHRGLSNWGKINEYLTDTCLTAQDQYKALLDYFKVKYL